MNSENSASEERLGKLDQAFASLKNAYASLAARMGQVEAEVKLLSQSVLNSLQGSMERGMGAKHGRPAQPGESGDSELQKLLDEARKETAHAREGEQAALAEVARLKKLLDDNGIAH